MSHENASQSGNFYQDFLLQNQIAEMVRENLPPRFIGKNGFGGIGEFKLTKEISNFSSAKIFSEIGKTCKVLMRFSGFHQSDFLTQNTDIKGFSVKFYTEDGNWDLVGSNLPVYYLKTPELFPEFSKIMKKNTEIQPENKTSFWEFCAKNPETLHAVLMQFSQKQNSENLLTDGFSGHAFSFYNSENERIWVKFQFKLEENKIWEKQNFAEISKKIKSGNFPKWKVSIQTMTDEEAQEYRWNPFDVTKVWLHDEFPPQEIGEISLHNILDNSELEKVAFSPANLVEGIGLSPDKILQSRLLSYTDAQRYRLGNDYKNLEINLPISGTKSGQKIPENFTEMQSYSFENENDHYTQAGLFYTKSIENQEERDDLISKISEDLKLIEESRRNEIVSRMLCHFFRANIELGMKIASEMQVNIDANIMNHAVGI